MDFFLGDTAPYVGIGYCLPFAPLWKLKFHRISHLIHQRIKDSPEPVARTLLQQKKVIKDKQQEWLLLFQVCNSYHSFLIIAKNYWINYHVKLVSTFLQTILYSMAAKLGNEKKCSWYNQKIMFELLLTPLYKPIESIKKSSGLTLKQQCPAGME